MQLYVHMYVRYVVRVGMLRRMRVLYVERVEMLTESTRPTNRFVSNFAYLLVRILVKVANAKPPLRGSYLVRIPGPSTSSILVPAHRSTGTYPWT